MHFPDPISEDDSEELLNIPPRRHEFAIEILKLLTPVLGLVLFIAGLSSKYPWLSTPWVRNALIFLGVLVLIWFAKPRLTVSAAVSGIAGKSLPVSKCACKRGATWDTVLN